MTTFLFLFKDLRHFIRQRPTNCTITEISACGTHGLISDIYGWTVRVRAATVFIIWWDLAMHSKSAGQRTWMRPMVGVVAVSLQSSYRVRSRYHLLEEYYSDTKIRWNPTLHTPASRMVQIYQNQNHYYSCLYPDCKRAPWILCMYRKSHQREQTKCCFYGSREKFESSNPTAAPIPFWSHNSFPCNHGHKERQRIARLKHTTDMPLQPPIFNFLDLENLSLTADNTTVCVCESRCDDVAFWIQGPLPNHPPNTHMLNSYTRHHVRTMNDERSIRRFPMSLQQT